VRDIREKIVLIDGQQLVDYMFEHNLGVVEVASYSVKRIALDELDYYDADTYVPPAGAPEGDGVPVEVS
jgi:hypothetical protein